MKKLLTLLFIISIATIADAAPYLSEGKFVEVSAANSVAAKNKAVSDTRKILVSNILKANATDSDVEKVDAAIAELTSKEILNMVASMNIADEKSSKTTYNANITINIDKDAMVEWFAKNNIESDLTNDVMEIGYTPVHITLNNGINQWTAFNEKLRENGLTARGGLSVLRINDNKIYAKIPTDNIRKFKSALTAANIPSNTYSGVITLSLPSDIK